MCLDHSLLQDGEEIRPVARVVQAGNTRDGYRSLKSDRAVGFAETVKEHAADRLFGLGRDGDGDASHDTASPELVDPIFEANDSKDTNRVSLLLDRRRGRRRKLELGVERNLEKNKPKVRVPLPLLEL